MTRDAEMKSRAAKDEKLLATSIRTWTIAQVTMTGFSLLLCLLVLTLKDLLVASSCQNAQQGMRDVILAQARAGDTVHTVLTSDGDPYQNWQTRILYTSYKIVQRQPGGEKMTGFTRILHRTVPDVLMEEVPTFHVDEPLHPECTVPCSCSYPPANRPNAIRQFFEAVRNNNSMIQGAWILMIETDYIFMRPLKAPGSAYDLSVPGLQLWFNYIKPQTTIIAQHMKRLYNISDTSVVPASGPAPVLLRLHEWLAVIPDYEQAYARLEADAAVVDAIGWVWDMYPWDVALAMHPEVHILTQAAPDSPLAVQPPADESLGNASMCHYTWGAIYIDSAMNKEVYRWDKRDMRDPSYVFKVPHIQMPPPFRPGLHVDIGEPLTQARHNLLVLLLTAMNQAINTLSDLTAYNQVFVGRILPKWKAERGMGSIEPAKHVESCLR